MATVKQYRVCDICGQKLSKDMEELKFRIEPRSKIRMAVWGYIWDDPYNGFWTTGIDMCQDCWDGMKEWIKEHGEKNKKESQ